MINVIDADDSLVRLDSRILAYSWLKEGVTEISPASSHPPFGPGTRSPLFSQTSYSICFYSLRIRRHSPPGLLLLLQTVGRSVFSKTTVVQMVGREI